MMILYTQVQLKQNNKFRTCWIPHKYANLGKYIILKKELGEWLVNKVFGSIEYEELQQTIQTQKLYKWVLNGENT